MFFFRCASHACKRCSLVAVGWSSFLPQRRTTTHTAPCLRVFYHGTYGEINSVLIAAGAAAQPCRVARAMHLL